MFSSRNLILSLLLLCLPIHALKIKVFCEGTNFSFQEPSSHRDGCLDFLWYLKDNFESKGHSVSSINLHYQEKNRYLPFLVYNTIDEDTDIVIVINITPGITNTIYDRNKDKDKKKIALYTIHLEPSHIDPNHYNMIFYERHNMIFILEDSFTQRHPYLTKYKKINFPQPDLTPLPVSESIPFKEKRFATLINSFKLPWQKSPSLNYDLYTKRIEIIEYFKNTEGFDFYGMLWDREYFGAYPSYKGKINNKKNVLKNYKFCFAFENCSDTSGYITEKIFDAFVADCVPIYWGAPNVTDYIPAECFIDMRNFKNYEELSMFLHTMDENTYNTYLTNIHTFLKSEKGQAFDAKIVTNDIATDILNNYYATYTN